MNLSKILILVTSVTLLSACGSKSGSGQPTMKKANNKSKVVVNEEGQVTFQSEQCEAINVETVKEFCTVAVERIKADDACKEELAIGFKANSCETQVDASEIADYLASVTVDEDGQSKSEDVEVVEVNPDEKVTGSWGKITVVSADLSSTEQTDVPVTTSVEVQDAVDTANDVAASTVTDDRSDVDVAHVVYIPDLSDNNTQVQVQSVPAVQVTNVEDTEKKTIETRIEEINDTEVQHISQRDPNMSLKDQARAKCKDLYKRIKERPTRSQMRKCVRSVEVRKVN